LSAYKAQRATNSMLLDGVRAGEQLLVVGEHGHIIVSNDDGQSWAQIDVPTRSALTGVDFADANTGYAVGHDAVILRTRDAGASWERVYFDPELQTPLLDVWVDSAQRAIAVGAYGLYLETNDGGETWERRPFFSEPLPRPEGEAEEAASDEDAEDEEYEDDYVDPEFGEEFHLNQIVAAADGTLYIAGETGRHYRSDNNGTTWYRLRPPYNGSFFGTLPLGGDALLAYGMRGNVFRSDDKGASYTAVDTGVNALLTGGFQTDAGKLLLVGLAGVVLESGDGGNTFSLHRQADRSGNMMVLPVGSGVVLMGESGVQRLDEASYRAGGEQ
ncbi:MAG: WD40/YVTN/BNR-like repeat-containing protein, partial [Gammaproteobacteria bacterium]